MTADLLETVVVPVASPDDSVETAAALKSYAGDVRHVTVVHVSDAAGEAPDGASAERREGVGTEPLGAFEETFEGATVDGRRVSGSDVVGAVVNVAADVDATAVVFSPRRGGRLVRYLSGDVALGLVTEVPVPVVSLPRVNDAP